MTAKKRILQLGLGVAAAALLAAVPPCSASAQDVLFPETIQVEEYTGTFQKEFHIDIDGDGEKEAIGYYYVGSPNQYPISGIYSVSDNGSEPYILYNRTANQRENCKIHIIQDKNTNETFIGYNTIVTNRSDSLYRLYSDNQSKLIINYRAEIDDSNKLEAYKTYMKNVDFLDEMAYGHGDVDGDADVTVSDAVAILSYYAATAAGQSPSFTELQKQAADFNQDGIIAVEDAVETLSLYAEHAAGIIDTVLLPATTRKDSNFSSLYGGTLKSTFYLDIDDDGKKETFGQYDHINLSYKLSSDCIFQVYDDGTFQGSYGVGNDHTNIWETMLVYDHNIDKIYLADYFSRPAGAYGYTFLRDIYLSYNESSNWGMSVYGSHSNVFEININGKDATEQELYDYLNQLEFISNPEEKEDILNQFKLIITNY